MGVLTYSLTTKDKAQSSEGGAGAVQTVAGELKRSKTIQLDARLTLTQESDVVAVLMADDAHVLLVKAELAGVRLQGAGD